MGALVPLFQSLSADYLNQVVEEHQLHLFRKEADPLLDESDSSSLGDVICLDTSEYTFPIWTLDMVFLVASSHVSVWLIS